MDKLIKQKYFWPILTFLLSIPAILFLLRPNMYFNMHDDMQMIRQLELEKCIQDGQIPCRWTPDLGYGYGYPLFNFYPPMPYIVGQIFRSVGFSFVASIKTTAIVQILLSSLFMYILATSIFGPIGGFISALFYTYAPYHALNIFVRGAMNEAWAGVFFPLIFYFSKKLVLDKKINNLFGLGLSFTGLLLSHNPMALTFTPILFIWVLFWIFYKYQKPFWPFIKKQINITIKLILSGLLAISLAAFYTFPVLLETKLVKINTMFEGYYHFSVHFAGLYQLFISNFWGDGASVWGPNDDMSFMIGYLHWIIPLTLFGYILVKIFLYKKNNKVKKIDYKYFLLIITILMGFATVFMTHNKSTFIWLLLPLIQKIQFPWRFLNHTVFLFSFSAGGLIFIIEKYLPQKKNILAIVLGIAVMFLNIKYFTPKTFGPITDAQKFSGKAWTNQVTSGIYDYLPKTASIAALGPAKDFVDEIQPSDSFFTVSNGKKGTDWMMFDLHLSRDSKVTLAQLAFPEFQVTSNNNRIPVEIEPQLGRLVINLPPGDHQIMVKLNNTPVRTVSNYISLFSWIFLLLYFSKPLWLRLIYKK